MKIWISILSVILFCACSGDKKEIIQGTVLDNSQVKIISLEPDKGKKIYLSEIIQSIRVKVLETTNESLIGDVLGIEQDGDYFIHNNIDKFVYIFDSIGNFKHRVGTRGNGPDEILYPECFALDKKRKEVLLSNNFRSINKYNYDGKLVEKEDIDIKFRKFFVSDGTYYFHASKIYNFDKKGNPVHSNLWIQNKDEYKLFFPYDPKIHLNGGLYFDTAIPFSQTSKGITYNYVFCDTIFSLEKTKVNPIYIINYNKNSITKRLNDVPGEEALEYFKENPNKAYYTQNVIETDSFLRLNYAMGPLLYEVFYDKNSNNHIEGILVNDLLGASIDLKNHVNNRLIGYFQSYDLDIKEKAYNFLDEETIKKIQSVDKEENNPILIEFELKPLKR